MITLLFLLMLDFILLVLISTRWVAPLKKKKLATKIPPDPSQLQEYLRQRELKIRPKPGTEKKIFQTNPGTSKSKISFVYLHGFTASRHEVSPVFETIAESLGAPLFMTRLHGHGLGQDELGETKKEQWLEDAIEAYRIGLTLGEEVVIACMSTGSALGLYLAYFYPEKIKALILLSPNLAPADPRSFLARGPLGKIITRLFLGKHRQLKAANSRQAYYWTMTYGTPVLTEMISLVTAVKELKFERIKIPTLTLYTPFDDVISASEIESNLPRMGSPLNKLIPLIETQSHVIAGDIMNPMMSERVIKECLDFLVPLLGTQKVFLKTGSE
jgi:esterase/lipase